MERCLARLITAHPHAAVFALNAHVIKHLDGLSSHQDQMKVIDAFLCHWQKVTGGGGREREREKNEASSQM